jgi:uncharacterized damage-inducible protein DinB
MLRAKEMTMKSASLIVLLTSLCLPGLATGQTENALRADLERDWTAQKARLIALAEAMPAEKYEFKATEGQRSYGEQLLHLAEAHVNMFKRLDPESKVPAPTVAKDHARDAVVKSVTDAYDYGLAVLKADPARSWSTPVKPGDPTPARTVWAAMGNAQNHYGQCVVYLRLNGIVPPASRR